MIECPNKTDDGHCLVAIDLLVEYDLDEAPVTPEACAKCVESSFPIEANEVTASLALYSIRTKRGRIPKDLMTDLQKFLANVDGVPDRGPGTELKRILSWFSITKDCRCNSHARQMNVWGADKCEKNLELIVDWLIEAAEKKGLLAARTITRHLARLAVRRAIKRARNQ